MYAGLVVGEARAALFARVLEWLRTQTLPPARAYA